jgi:hypothetical protein
MNDDETPLYIPITNISHTSFPKQIYSEKSFHFCNKNKENPWIFSKKFQNLFTTFRTNSCLSFNKFQNKNKTNFDFNFISQLSVNTHHTHTQSTAITNPTNQNNQKRSTADDKSHNH